MLVIRAGIRKMLVRIANRGDPDQTASDLSPSLSRLFLASNKCLEFRTFTKLFSLSISIL